MVAGPGSDSRASTRVTPVVVIAAEALVPVARAGALLASAGATLAVVTDPTMVELSGACGGSEVVICVCGRVDRAEALVWTGALGATGLPALEIVEHEAGSRISHATMRLLGDTRLEGLNVAVPLVGDAVRGALWDQLRAARIEERHHPVEVDGRPALVALRSRGFPISDQDARHLAAGAAGVLAGRMAAGNRAWNPPAG